MYHNMNTALNAHAVNYQLKLITELSEWYTLRYITYNRDFL